MIIAFIGSGGTGKSTTAKIVLRKLKSEGFKVKYLHLRGKGPISKLVQEKGQRERSKIDLFQRLKKFGRKIWPYLKFIDANLYYNSTLRRSSKNAILICDRYFYDEYVDYIQRKFCGNECYRLISNLPKPDLVFWFDARPEVILRRKKEVSLSYLIRERRCFKRIAKLVNAIHLNSEVNQQKIVDLIFKRIKERV